MDTRIPNDPQFNKYYTKHCKYLKLKGLQPKTIGNVQNSWHHDIWTDSIRISK